MLKSWNQNWEPEYFMMDYSDAEMAIVIPHPTTLLESSNSMWMTPVQQSPQTYWRVSTPTSIPSSPQLTLHTN